MKHTDFYGLGYPQTRNDAIGTRTLRGIPLPYQKRRNLFMKRVGSYFAIVVVIKC